MCNKRYYEKHKEERKEYRKACSKKYYENHKEEIKERKKIYDKEYYDKHREKRKEYRKKYILTHPKEQERLKMKDKEKRKDRKRRKREFVRTVKDVKCADCKKKYPYYVMQFDHINPKNKLDNINILISRGDSWDTIKNEIKKCEVVCANCHAKRTYNRRFNWRKLPATL